MADTFETQGLWVKNQGRLTTTDALNIDWFYCIADNKYPDQGINRDYIHKATTECAGVDRIGVVREVFNDRICDGFVDCFDLSDENGDLGTCLMEHKQHPHRGPNDGQCPFAYIGTHNFMEECVGQEQDDMGNWKTYTSEDGFPAWHCATTIDMIHNSNGYPSKGYDFWIYHTTLTYEQAWPLTEKNLKGGNTTGWVYSRKTIDLNDSDLDDKDLLAFHPGPESCLVLTTTTNKGNVDITLLFKTKPGVYFNLQRIDYDEPFEYCFPSEELESYHLQNTDGDKWVGDVSMTHSDEKYGTLMQCELNCGCQCTGTEAEDCSPECLEQEVINLGLDDDSNSDGDTKCLESASCHFKVSWNVAGTVSTI